MTTSPGEIPFLRDTPVNSVKRIEVAIPVDRFSLLERRIHLKSGRASFEACSNGFASCS
jgi:hypothetical protein